MTNEEHYQITKKTRQQQLKRVACVTMRETRPQTKGLGRKPSLNTRKINKRRFAF